MSQIHGTNSQHTVPPPGALVAVDLTEAKARNVIDTVRQRVAMWGDAARTMTRACEAVRTAERLIGSGPGPMAAEFRPNGRRVLRLNELPDDEPLWIVGDLRGDVLALETILCFIDEATHKNRAPQIAFLGDIAGGTSGDAACVAIVMERFAAAPTRTIVIAGDRELLLNSDTLDATADRKPRGLADMPVQVAQQKLLDNLVQSLAELAQKIPVAVICPDGMLLTHSALPQVSVLKHINSAQALEERADVLRSFATNRLHTREPHVIASHITGGTNSESQEFADSLLQLHSIFGIQVQRMVRAQDAAPEGHRWFRHYGEGVVLTITSMADVLSSTMGGGRRKPCVARFKSGTLRVVRFDIPADLAATAEQLFPRNKVVAPSQPASPSNTHALEQTKNMLCLDFEPEQMRSAPPIEKPAPTQATQIHFERGIRLLAARAWLGARQAFQEAASTTTNSHSCVMNQATASLLMGLNGHQDALRICREMIQKNSADADAHFNMGVSYLISERNPTEASRSFRAATQARPNFADAWWALGLACAMRSDKKNATDAFAIAAKHGCHLAPPYSFDGMIPTRELTEMLGALRARVMYHPTLQSPPVAMTDT